MRYQAILMLLPSLALAVPLLPKITIAPDDVFCTVNGAVVSALQADRSATSYCSSYLSIATQTFTSTETITPDPVTTTSTITASPVTTVETATTVTVSSVLATTTTTRTVIITSSTTTTLSCLSSAYPAYSGPRTKRELGGTSLAQPEVLPTTLASPIISDACSCLSIPTPSTTTTTTTTLKPRTITETTTYTPTVTSTAIVTSTSTTVVGTVTITSTSTQIQTTTVPNFVRNGVRYRKYTHNQQADKQYSASFAPSSFQRTTPDRSGTNRDVTFDTRGGRVLTLDDASFDAEYAMLVMQAFFVADQTGIYTITTSKDFVDNWNSLWANDAAYTWQDGIQVYNASRTTNDRTNDRGGSYNVSHVAGNATPLTFLWANGGGEGRSAYQVIAPNGTAYQSLAQFLIQPCASSLFK